MKFQFVRRSIRKIYGSKMEKSPRKLPNDWKCLKLDVRLKIWGEWVTRSLVFRLVPGSIEDPDPKWMMYIISNDEYTYYEAYNASTNFIAHIFKKTDKKCTILFTESIFEMKLNSDQEKWRLVEFLNANLKRTDLIYRGSLIHRPGRRSKTQRSVQVLIHTTTISIVDALNAKILGHLSLDNGIGLAACVDENLYVTKLKKRQIQIDNVDYWSIRCENIERVWNEMRRHRKTNRLPFDFYRLYKLNPKESDV